MCIPPFSPLNSSATAPCVVSPVRKMSTAADVRSVVEAFNVKGSCATTADVEGKVVHVRFSRMTTGGSLSGLNSVPPLDADLACDVDLLRQRLRPALRIPSGPPLFVTKVLAALTGNTGPEFATTAAGLRVLL